MSKGDVSNAMVGNGQSQSDPRIHKEKVGK
jgi:hypothetical protein